MRRALLALALIAGCKSKVRMPSCTEVTDHLVEITTKAYPGHGEMVNRNVEIARCKERKPSAEERQCIMTATTLETLAACRKAKD